MRQLQPPPGDAGSAANRASRPRRRLDLTLPMPQRDTSLAAPLPLPPSSASSSVSLYFQVEHSELKRIRRIGSGAGGTVYKVFHRPTGKIYALKVMYGNHKDAIRNQMRREIQILRDVDNPNVVRCHDLIDHNGQIQVVLEYMDKGSLEGTHIPHEPTLSDLARQILCGLCYLHRLKIVHRDIKPSNLLTNSRGVVKIADVGMSRILAQILNNCNSSVGTIAYMSPERITTDLNHGRYDGYAGDIWSLGISILEFYLGKFPFAIGRQGHRASLMRAIRMSQPPEAPATASRDFRDFIGCCLHRDPAKRWTAAQLLRHPFITQYASPAPPPESNGSSSGNNNEAKGAWTRAEDEVLMKLAPVMEPQWESVAEKFASRSAQDCQDRWEELYDTGKWKPGNPVVEAVMLEKAEARLLLAAMTEKSDASQQTPDRKSLAVFIDEQANEKLGPLPLPAATPRPVNRNKAKGAWTRAEDEVLMKLAPVMEPQWESVAEKFASRSAQDCQDRWEELYDTGKWKPGNPVVEAVVLEKAEARLLLAAMTEKSDTSQQTPDRKSLAVFVDEQANEKLGPLPLPAATPRPVDRNKAKGAWTRAEDEVLMKLAPVMDPQWESVAEKFASRSAQDCQDRWEELYDTGKWKPGNPVVEAVMLEKAEARLLLAAMTEKSDASQQTPDRKSLAVFVDEQANEKLGPLPLPVPAATPRPVDRNKICPFLVRVFTKVGGHHTDNEFAVRGKEPTDEVHVYTWMDATLCELSNLVKEVAPEARKPEAILSFAFVYPNKHGRYVVREVGRTFPYPNARRLDSGNKTLVDLNFQIGDWLDLAILLPQ